MKKILPYILMFLVFANLFAPFTVGTAGNDITIKSTSAEADVTATLTIDYTTTDTSIYAVTKVVWSDSSFKTNGGVLLKLTNNATGADVGSPINVPLSQIANDAGAPATAYTEKGSVTIPSLSPSTSYTINAIALQSPSGWSTLINSVGGVLTSLWLPTGPNVVVSATPQLVTTNVTGNTTPSASTRSQTSSPVTMPACGVVAGPGTIMGCVAQGIYYVLFVPTSFIFALTGEFFDWTFAYSVNDTSYRSTFVVQGWGIVRDFCNMFFIFVLLYVAFATILDLGGHFKTKSVIINVIIVGLFINFSLFTTQVIIDMSNILARVFYNSNAIVITQGPNAANCVTTGGSGCLNSSTTLTGPNGEIPLSAALVNKVNPQNLIINSSKVGVITSGKANTGVTATTADLDTGTFILVTFLAVFVNIVGLIVFLSVGLIFVSRVIGLWLAIIFSPLMFFSYTVPGLGGMDMFGHQKWWPETLKLAFLAPIFIFFLYLILQFLNTGLDLIQANGQTGINFVMAIMIPFVFIMVLLWQAKNIANKMSGTLGQSITGGITTAAGLALGGAALGAAAVGRNTAGSVSKYVQNDGARKTDANPFRKDLTFAQRLNPTTYTKAIAANIARPLNAIGRKRDEDGNVIQKGFLQREASKIGDKSHSAHVLDEKAQAMKNDKTAKFKDLTEAEQKSLKDKIDRDIIAKELFNKTYDKLDVSKGEREEVDNYKHPDINGKEGDWAWAARKAQEQAHGRGEHIHSADDMAKASKANTVIGEFVTALRKGSYDVRNISQVKTANKGLAKAGVGLVSGVATGVRTALKAANVNHGSGQGEFTADLKHTITEAMKSAKVSVKVEQSHGQSAAEAEGHGDGGHH
jgi:hypothetical protein